MTRAYPEDPVGGFPTPPRAFTDDEGRTVRVGGLSDREALVTMYLAFDPADRAQGVPPTEESAIREWLDRVTGEGTLNVVARHDGRTVGHATLVGDVVYELAIFVVRSHQGAGVGTELLATTLGAAGEAGIEQVWLSVERWNRPAIALYRTVGFEHVDNPDFGMEMTLRLEADGPRD